MIEKVTALTDSVGKGLDNLTSTAEERDQHVTKRHELDMKSDFWLAQAIRPLSYALTIVAQIALSFYIIKLDNSLETVITIFGGNSAILASMVGFYFNSRKMEKIAHINAMANIALQESKIKEREKEVALKLKEREAEIKLNERERKEDLKIKEKEAEFYLREEKREARKKRGGIFRKNK